MTMKFVMLLVLITAFGRSSQIGTKPNLTRRAFENTLHVGYLSVRHFQVFNRWPNSMEDLNAFSLTNDSLRTLYDSVSSQVKFEFHPALQDSVQIRVSPADPANNSFTWTVWITPRTFSVKPDSTEFKEFRVNFVNDTSDS